MELTIEQKEFRDWFLQTQNKYHHDLLNDAFYDQILFQRKENGYFVEIGGLDGWVASQSIFFEHVKNWSGIIVEPNPLWLNDLSRNRTCSICTDAISDQTGQSKFICRSASAFSHLWDVDLTEKSDEAAEEIPIDTLTLFDMLNKYKAPKEIDFISLDTEGYELRILTKFFEENKKYKVNLINLEFYDGKQVDRFFRDKPYVRINNPYLNLIKIDEGTPEKEGLGILRLSDDFRYYTYDKTMVYFGDVTNLRNVGFEHYFVHVDYLRDNLQLKQYLGEDLGTT